MTTYTRTTRPNLAGSRNSISNSPREVDIFQALSMFYNSEGDLFRLQSALRHLEIIEVIQRLNTGFPGGSKIPERGGFPR
jgi:hypothetical protein